MAAKTGVGHEPPEDGLTTRETICISLPAPNSVIHNGDHGFPQELGRHYRSAESKALERLIHLKAALKAAQTEEEFWPMATEGLGEITGAQYAFISKRMVVDNEDANVEMPPYGTPGSCTMSQALYYNDGRGTAGTGRNLKFSIYGAPCEHMKHDKVFLIPERLNEAILDNPNAASFIVPAEAYLAVPLFDNEGKCFAHFGAMWSLEGLKKIQLGWPFIELLFHSIEDVMLAGFIDRGRFASALRATANPNAVIPHEAIAATQSLKPYARNLSHELRTPMQGVVGMLDVMYATVQEAAEGLQDQALRAVLETLKENIEVVQDSSRRAVEAADNVVHAYDMNMGVPDTPVSPPDEGECNEPNCPLMSKKEKRPDIVVTGESVPINFKGTKRRREANGLSHEKAHKLRKIQKSVIWPEPRAEGFPTIPEHASTEFGSIASRQESVRRDFMSPTSAHLENCEQTSVPPGLRHTNLRDVLQFLINDLLKVGGRPESAIAQETDEGEIIEVRSRSPNGDERMKTIRWSVHSAVPTTILIEEQSLVKVISSVYSNAVKFTDEGEVSVQARLSPRSRYVVISVSDTGSGINEEFVPKLFQPFSKEDDSLTRQSEGLGLGLMVAKGLARKLGGDLNLVHTKTAGEKRGSEFEIRVPITPSDSTSRPSTPSSSPGPNHPGSRHSILDGLEQLDESLQLRADHVRSPALASIQFNRYLEQPRKSTSPPTSLHHRTPSSKSVKEIPPPSSTRLASPKKRGMGFDRGLATKYPLNFLVVEDNKINRTLLVSMLKKLGYKNIYEAYDGAQAVRQMEILGAAVDVVLMDLWMPFMDGYEASEKILAMDWNSSDEEDGPVADRKTGYSRRGKRPTILAVTADVTDGALERADKAGMKGFLTKPFKVADLERLIVEYCATTQGVVGEAVVNQIAPSLVVA
jgi:signal transduction histidine kinase/DNA-binding NarL/FixJ family response regulator